MADEAAKKEAIYAPESFAVDEIDVSTETSEEEIKEVKDDKVKSTEDEVEIEVEGKEKKVETEETETEKLRREVSSLKDEILTLSTRKEYKPDSKPKIEAKDEKLTRGQIAKILSEHKDDPEVLLNVIDYVAEQKATEIKDTTVKDLNYKQWSSQLSGVAGRILSEDEDGYLAANPKVVAGLDEMASNLGLGDHPAGKLAAYAIYRLSEFAKGKSQKDAQSLREKDVHSKKTMDKTRTSTTDKQTAGLNSEQLIVAKRLGLTTPAQLSLYAKFAARRA